MTPVDEPGSMRGHVPPPGRAVRPPDVGPAGHATGDGDRPRRRSRGWRQLAELPLLVVVALALAFLIKSFLVQAFYIPSGSMIDTLEINDRVIVEKVSYRFREPDRGEVIVFRRPGHDDGREGIGGIVRSFLEGLGLVPAETDIDLIKRVVGLPGETVEIREGVVHIDGQAIEEPYARLDGRDVESTTVPDDHYFMLGDNRANSDDSRYSLGAVPRDHVVGRAFVIIWPPSRVTVALDHDYPELLSSPVGASGAVAHLPERPPFGLPAAHANAGG